MYIVEPWCRFLACLLCMHPTLPVLDSRLFSRILKRKLGDIPVSVGSGFTPKFACGELAPAWFTCTSAPIRAIYSNSFWV